MVNTGRRIEGIFCTQVDAGDDSPVVCCATRSRSDFVRPCSAGKADNDICVTTDRTPGDRRTTTEVEKRREIRAIGPRCYIGVTETSAYACRRRLTVDPRYKDSHSISIVIVPSQVVDQVLITSEIEACPPM